MVKILRTFILKKDLLELQGQSFGQKVKYFWEKGWREIPEIMVMIPPAIVSMFGMVYVCSEQLKEEKRLPRYFSSITIFRPNDPRVAKIRKDDYLTIERPI